MKTLDVHVGGALRYERLAVFPIFVSTDSPVAYRLGSEVARAGKVGLVQLPDSGPQSPQPLIVDNREDIRVLLPAGIPLLGRTANPILNASVLLPARSKVRISTAYLDPKWATMASRQRPETEMPTRILGECKQTLAYVDRAAGVAAAVGRRLIAVELFDQPSACRQIWGGLLDNLVSFALEPLPSGWAQTLDVQRLLFMLSNAAWQRVETAGDGDLHRVVLGGLGRAISLSVEGQLIHVSFVADRPDPRGKGP
ncbi:MAG: ARPP-1 family domain-containing protein [Thermoguttaceae bacterium]